VPRDVAGEREKEGDRELGDGPGVGSGRRADLDAELLRRRDIDVVHAASVLDDDAERPGFQHPPRHRVDSDDRARAAVDERDHLAFVERPVLLRKPHVEAVQPRKVVARCLPKRTRRDGHGGHAEAAPSRSKTGGSRSPSSR
jgi:hypothetical protein